MNNSREEAHLGISSMFRLLANDADNNSTLLFSVLQSLTALADATHEFMFDVSPLSVFHHAVVADLLEFSLESSYSFDDSDIEHVQKMKWFDERKVQILSTLIAELKKLRVDFGDIDMFSSEGQQQQTVLIREVAVEFSETLKAHSEEVQETILEVVDILRKSILVLEMLRIIEEKLREVFPDFYHKLMAAIYHCEVLGNDLNEFFAVLLQEGYKDRLSSMRDSLMEHVSKRNIRVLDTDALDHSQFGQSEHIIRELKDLDSSFVANHFRPLFNSSSRNAQLSAMLEYFTTTPIAASSMQTIASTHIDVNSQPNMDDLLQSFADQLAQSIPSEASLQSVDTAEEDATTEMTLRELLSLSDFEMLQLLNEVAIMGVSDSGRLSVEKIVLGSIGHVFDQEWQDFQFLDEERVHESKHYQRCNNPAFYRLHFMRVFCSRLTTMSSGLLGYIRRCVQFLDSLNKLCFALMNNPVLALDDKRHKDMNRILELVARKIKLIKTWWENDTYHGKRLKSRIDIFSGRSSQSKKTLDQAPEPGSKDKNPNKAEAEYADIKDEFISMWRNFKAMYDSAEMFVSDFLKISLPTLSKTHPESDSDQLSSESQIIARTFFWLLPLNKRFVTMRAYFVSGHVKCLEPHLNKLLALACSNDKVPTPQRSPRVAENSKVKATGVSSAPTSSVPSLVSSPREEVGSKQFERMRSESGDATNSLLRPSASDSTSSKKVIRGSPFKRKWLTRSQPQEKKATENDDALRRAEKNVQKRRSYRQGKPRPLRKSDGLVELALPRTRRSISVSEVIDHEENEGVQYQPGESTTPKVTK